MRWPSPFLHLRRPPRSRARALVVALLAGTLALLAGAAPAGAATHTWTGGGADDNWSTPANWSGGVPTSDEPDGTVVEFTGGTQSVMDLDLTVDALQLTGNGNVIEGDATHTLRLSSAIEEHAIDSAGAGNELRAGLEIEVLASPFPTLVRTSGGELTIGASISGVSEARLRFISPDAGVASGAELTGVNPFAGIMAVQSGLLRLRGAGSSTTVQASSLAAELDGVLELAEPAQIDDATEVAVLDGGTLDLNGQSEAIEELIVADGGTADLGSGTLLVTGPVLVRDGGNLDVAMGTLQAGGLLTVQSSTVSGASESRIDLQSDVRLVPGAEPAVIRASLTLNADRTFVVEPGGRGSVINGSILEGSGGPNTLIKQGAGVLRLSSPNAPNTYSGGTTIVNGALSVEFATMIPAGTVTIGDGAGAAESAALEVDDQAAVAQAANVIVAGDGLYRYAPASSSARLASLTINGGRATGDATSTLALGSLAFAGGSIDGLLQVEVGSSLSGEGTVEVPVIANGLVEPTGTGLHAGPLTLGASARLRTTINGGATSPLFVVGPVSIDPAAQLELIRAPGTTTPSGTTIAAVVVQGTGASDRITGAFANAPDGGTLTLGAQPFGVAYAAGDGGNDLVLTADPPPPATPSPTPVVAPTPTPAPRGDVVAPVLKLSVRRSQRLRRVESWLSARITANEAARARVVLSIKPPGAAKALTATATIRLTAGKARTIALALPMKARIAARKAVRRGKAVTVRLTVTLRDAAGNASKPATTTITLRG